MIDVDIEQRLGAFDLAVAFRAEAPVVGLFGRSGSGKTSVINALAGISRPRRGRIEVNGETLFDSARGIDVPPRTTAHRLRLPGRPAVSAPDVEAEPALRASGARRRRHA